MLGARVVPPVGLTRVTVLARSLIGRVHRATAPPPVRILETALGGLEPAALAALCHLDVPDQLTGPVSVTGLADGLDVDATRLERLLRFAHVRGWVRLDRRSRVHPTRLTAFLRPGGRKRTVDELTELGRAVGLGRQRWFALASGDVAVVFGLAASERGAT